jgi:hypothetical protein
MKSMEEILVEEIKANTHINGEPCSGSYCMKCQRKKALQDAADKYIFQVGE